MDNVAWDSIQAYNDISSHGQYDIARGEGLTDEEAMKLVHRYSRDNARTPMQWTKEKQAGFTAGTPWLPVHADYADCCVESESADEASVLSFYRKLSRLRGTGKAAEVLQGGSYQELLEGNEDIYAFRRRSDGRETITLVNFAGKTVSYAIDDLQEAELLISTQPESEKGVLRPYEAVCYWKEQKKDGRK